MFNTRKDLASSETQDFFCQTANPAVTLPQGKLLCFGLELAVLALDGVGKAKLGNPLLGCQVTNSSRSQAE